MKKDIIRSAKTSTKDRCTGRFGIGRPAPYLWNLSNLDIPRRKDGNPDLRYKINKVFKLKI